MRPTLVLLLMALFALLPGSVIADAGVTATTDADTYAPGADVVATVTNGTSSAIAPQGGIVCQGSPWPFRVQQLADDGTWQDLAYPNTPPCVGITAALLPPGESRSRTLQASASPGEFRIVYTYQTSDGSQGTAISDPFSVEGS